MIYLTTLGESSFFYIFSFRKVDSLTKTRTRSGSHHRRGSCVLVQMYICISHAQPHFKETSGEKKGQRLRDSLHTHTHLFIFLCVWCKTKTFLCVLISWFKKRKKNYYSVKLNMRFVSALVFLTLASWWFPFQKLFNSVVFGIETSVDDQQPQPSVCHWGLWLSELAD